jgi:hypothetical protein
MNVTTFFSCTYPATATSAPVGDQSIIRTVSMIFVGPPRGVRAGMSHSRSPPSVPVSSSGAVGDHAASSIPGTSIRPSGRTGWRASCPSAPAITPRASGSGSGVRSSASTANANAAQTVPAAFERVAASLASAIAVCLRAASASVSARRHCSSAAPARTSVSATAVNAAVAVVRRRRRSVCRPAATNRCWSGVGGGSPPLASQASAASRSLPRNSRDPVRATRLPPQCPREPHRVLAHPVVVVVDRGQHGPGDLLRARAVAGVDPLQCGQLGRRVRGVGDEHRHQSLAQLHRAFVLATALARVQPVGAEEADEGVGLRDGLGQLVAPNGGGRDVVAVEPELAIQGLGGPHDGEHGGAVAAGVRHKPVSHVAPRAAGRRPS